MEVCSARVRFSSYVNRKFIRYFQLECCCAVPTSDFQTCLAARFVGSRHCTAAFFLEVPKSCTDIDTSLLYILILETYSKLIRKNKMLTLGVCFPQPSPSRALAAGTLRRDHVWIPADKLFHFHKDELDEILCKLNSTKYARAFQLNPTLPEEGVGYFSNQRRFSVESILQRFSSIFLLWKRIDSLVVL